MDSIQEHLVRLASCGIEFVVVGGAAAVIRGSSFVTENLHICAQMTPQNLANLSRSLSAVHPRWRTNPKHPALADDPARLVGFKNLYLFTDLGQLDVLGDVPGVGGWPEVLAASGETTIRGHTCRVLTTDALIRAKRAVGRPKDLAVAIELEAIQHRLANSG